MEEQPQQEQPSQEIPGQPQTPTLSEALAALEQRSEETSSLRAALGQRDAELAGLRGQLAAAGVRYRDALLAAVPDVPPDLISGATPDELDASMLKARQLVERIRSQPQSQPQKAGARVPAGAPVRSATDLSSLSPQEKIAYALAQRH